MEKIILPKGNNYLKQLKSLTGKESKTFSLVTEDISSLKAGYDSETNIFFISVSGFVIQVGDILGEREVQQIDYTPGERCIITFK